VGGGALVSALLTAGVAGVTAVDKTSDSLVSAGAAALALSALLAVSFVVAGGVLVRTVLLCAGELLPVSDESENCSGEGRDDAVRVEARCSLLTTLVPPLCASAAGSHSESIEGRTGVLCSVRGAIASVCIDSLSSFSVASSTILFCVSLSSDKSGTVGI